jgi:putative membrane protein
MKSKLFIIAAAAALAPAIAATAAADQGGSRHARISPRTMTYVAKAGASDMYEIESAQLAMSRSRRPQIRQFAQMLLSDHRRTTQEVMAAARASGMTPPPPVMEPQQRRMIRQLEAARGAGFDRTFVNQQVMAHQQALALHQTYARNGDAPALRRVASTAVPIIRGHLQHARRLPR